MSWWRWRRGWRGPWPPGPWWTLVPQTQGEPSEQPAREEQGQPSYPWPYPPVYPPYPYPPIPWFIPPPPPPPSPEEELRMLEEYKRELEEELRGVEERIRELRKMLGKKE